MKLKKEKEKKGMDHICFCGAISMVKVSWTYDNSGRSFYS